MKLIIVTQTIDEKDPNLGFFVRWVAEFAKNCEQVHVLALNVGTYELPRNVTVHCLGKSEGRSKLVWLWRLWRHSWQLRKDYDAVFVHMNPEYVIFGAPLWRVLGKRVGLWYAHGAVTLKLRLATLLSQVVLTSTLKGFRLPSKKRVIVGQGIDTKRFAPTSSPNLIQDKLELVTVGRISSAKNLDFLLGVAAALKKGGTNFRFRIVGAPQSKNESEYLAKLHKQVKNLELGEQVTFAGAVSQLDLPALLRESHIFLSAGETGSLDKTLLEAIACGIITLSSNEAYRDFAASPGKKLTFEPNNIEELLRLIEQARNSQVGYLEETVRLRKEIERNHSIDNLVKNIITTYV